MEVLLYYKDLYLIINTNIYLDYIVSIGINIFIYLYTKLNKLIILIN